ncbi:uncharacterized mitochondrial protein AtMg00810-like [Nicotiana sylvestris]|uniref:uncharacterized mitochondrial protein AtMg00810-like n=1 Tax=Nicotiana sylvestris TaxID=4096 RepID=UPI00388C84C0
MTEEYNALMANNTWQLVLPPPNANIIGCHWVYKVKQRSDGSIEYFKARLVAQGYSQQYGLDYDQTFSPMVKPVTIRTVIALAASKEIAILLLYVDDILLTASSSSLLRSLIQSIKSEFAMNDLGLINYFLYQFKYIQDLLRRANLLFSKSVSTPLSSKTLLHTSDSPPFSNPTLYRSLVGGLQYLTFTRPDIAFIVNQVSQFMHTPLEVHYTVVKRILHYLNGSLSHGLFIRGGSMDQLTCYSDADWAGCPTTRRSTSAYCLFLGANLISWSSKK